jgi:hypothetical protein
LPWCSPAAASSATDRSPAPQLLVARLQQEKRAGTVQVARPFLCKRKRS